MPDNTAPNDLARLERRLASSPRARSPLFRWLLDHYDEVSRLVRRYGRNWTAMAAGLNELGVTRRHGAAVSADSLRKTWSEVQRLETARRKDETAGRGVAATPPEGNGAPGPAAVGSTEPEFAPARLKSGYRAADVASSAAEAPRAKTPRHGR